MAPKSQRSRACTQCRERRVKCDETPEVCDQCRRLGLACSGPLVGSIVIDMTERVVKSRGRKKKTATRTKSDNSSVSQKAMVLSPKAKAVTSILDTSVESQTAAYTPEMEKAIAIIRYQHQPPKFHQPIRAIPDALDAAFLTHFVEINRGKRTLAPEVAWLSQLPTIARKTTKPAVRLSLRAISMAFYAKIHQDSSVLADSWRWYQVSLKAQRMSIAHTMKCKTVPTEEEVLVPMMLALYEANVGATQTGMQAHFSAAAQIMYMRGPSNCNSGNIWPLFKSIRISEGQMALIFNKPSAFSAPEWMSVPFADIDKDVNQQLADIVLMIPHCTTALGISGSIRKVFHSRIPPNVDLLPCTELGTKLMSDLDRWATTYPHLTTASKEQSQRSDALEPADASVKSTEVPNSYAQLIALNYMSTRLVLNMIIHKVKPGDDHHERAVRDAAAVLQGIVDITTTQSPHFDSMRCLPPLIMVVCAAPTPELLMKAQKMLQAWSAKLGGLGPLISRI